MASDDNRIGGYFTPERLLTFAQDHINDKHYSLIEYISNVKNYLIESPRKEGAIRVVKVMGSYVDFIL